ncbi:MAG: pyruvate carboxylase subunit B [Chthoniobacterales bacterium]|nr:pyruvate carboxylase subunit B [Chthoniobacterales bacterium]
MSKNRVCFTNTVLRDGHQSLAATRMRTEQMLPALDDLDALGFYQLETWGGATIDACLRYLGENPFERISALKKGAPQTPHGMLLRGQNIVQYTSFPDDVVEAFVNCAANRGMDVIRIFDALNDPRNLETSIRATLAAGKHARGEICYTISPVHTIEAFVEFGEELADLGCQSVSIKDMAGLITPKVAYDLVSALKKRINVPILLHSHDTAGLAASAYLAAVEAGADAVETSIVPFANGTSQPDTLRMMALLDGHPRCPDYDRVRLARLRTHFEKVYAELHAFTNPVNERVDVDILTYQVPGGMLSNFRNQLKEQGMADRYEEVLREMPVVRAALGHIPLVTPTSQIVGTQAMLNVKFGRWKMISQPAQDVVLGKYGRTPGPVDGDLLALVEKQSGRKAVTVRPADLLEPGLPALRDKLKEEDLPEDDETAVLYAMFPVETARLLRGEKPKEARTPAAPDAAPLPSASTGGRATRYVMHIESQKHLVEVEELGS